MSRKQFLLSLALCGIVLLMTPLDGMTRAGRYHPPGPYFPPPGPIHHHYSYYSDDALAWGFAGLVIGSMLALAVSQPQVITVPRREIVYAPPSPVTGYGQIYSYPPEVPPGMCRWERVLLDQYGRPIITETGVPAKVYTLGSCYTPPAY